MVFPVVAPAPDAWPTYACNYTRNATFCAKSSPITAATVTGLRQRWTVKLRTGGFPSPLVVAGTIYTLDGAGELDAVASANGAVRWKRQLPEDFRTGRIAATPTYANGALYLVEHFRYPTPSYVYAVRASDGAVLWRSLLPGPSHANPIVANGMVYVAYSQSDDDKDPVTGLPQAVIQGGVRALRTTDGTSAWQTDFKVDPSRTDNGGGVWGNGTYLNGVLHYGTSNTHLAPAFAAESVVRLDALTGTLLGRTVNPSPDSDDDFVQDMQWAHSLYGIGKSGTLYAWDEVSGAPRWATSLGAPDELGGIATPTTDGSTVMVSGGYYGAPPAQGRLCGVSISSGAFEWCKNIPYALRDYVSVLPGVAFYASGKVVTAIAPATGAVLWTSPPSPCVFYNAPVIVNSGMYTNDACGNLSLWN